MPAEGRSILDIALGCNMMLARYLQGYWECPSLHPPPLRDSGDHRYRPGSATPSRTPSLFEFACCRLPVTQRNII